LKDPQSPVSEAYRSLATALQFSTEEGLPRSIAITSAGAGEGKSSTAVALARHFANLGSKVLLIDPSGVLLELPARSSKKYSFPLITGMQEPEPLSTRAARMKIYSRLVDALDAGGANYSRSISEVELSDPDDVKLTVSDPDGAVLVHLGDEQFLDRYRIYLAHVQEWRQQFGKVESVDLRYDRQVIVNPDSKAGAPHSVPLARKASQSRAAPVRRRAGTAGTCPAPR